MERIKQQILKALQHPEASDGLYFRNFYHLHEEDERPAVEAEEQDILQALDELVDEGVVTLDNSDEELIFRLANGIEPTKVM